MIGVRAEGRIHAHSIRNFCLLKESRDKLIFMLDQNTTLTLFTLKQKHFLLPPVKDCSLFLILTLFREKYVFVQKYGFPLLTKSSLVLFLQKSWNIFYNLILLCVWYMNKKSYLWCMFAKSLQSCLIFCDPMHL